MTLAATRAALVSALGSISGLRIYSVALETVNELPCIILRPGSGDYHFSGGVPGTNQYRFELILLIQRGGSWAEAQTTLDAYLDETAATSVYRALETASVSGYAFQAIGFKDYGGLAYGSPQESYFGAKIDAVVTG